MGVIRHFSFRWIVNKKQKQVTQTLATIAFVVIGFLFSSFYLDSANTVVLDCDNVTSPGTISGNETSQGPFDPTIILNTQLPSGGSGTLEYLWLMSTADNVPPIGDPSWSSIPNSNTPDYDPGPITQTTHYIRCSRRSECTAYTGESNVVTKTVVPCNSTPPSIITEASDLDVECNGFGNISEFNSWFITNAGASASGNNLSWTNDYNGIFDIECGNAKSITITFTVSDQCSNTAQTTATFSIEDTEAPDLLGVPDDESIDCDDNLPSTNNISATDICDAFIEINLDEDNQQGDDPSDCSFYNYEVVRTWTAIDDCGNSSTASQTITVEDNTAPQILVEASDLTVECDGSGNQSDLDDWLATYAGSAATDNCSALTWDHDFNGFPSADCANTGEVEVGFTAKDACGNSISRVAIFKIIDTTPPQLLSVPDDETVDCNDVPGAPTNVLATDNCDTQVEVIFDEYMETGDCNNSFNIIRTWTATDDCGNESVQSQTITVGDDAAPVFTQVPAPTTIDCLEPLQFEMPEATDDCGDPVITFEDETISGACLHNYEVQRTWIATDACGNSSTAVSSVNVEDILEPTLIGLPVDETIDLTIGETIPPPADVIASDLCDDNVEVIFDEVETPGSCGYLITRTWTAIDDCGNEASGQQEITVINGLTGTVDASNNGLLCEGQTLELYASPDGGQYQWTGPNSFSSTEQNPVIVNVTEDYDGEYILTVTDASCIGTTTTTVEIYPELTVDYTITDVTCDNAGSINVGVSGGSGNYKYDWDDLPGTDDPQDRDNLSPGVYNLTVSDEDGTCVFDASGLIVTNNCDCEAEAGDITADADPVCLANSDALISATSLGNQVVPPGYAVIYVLTQGPNLTFVGVNTNPIFTVYSTGAYTIHTLVYDPTTLDLSVIMIGVTTAADVLSLITQGGGDICAALDVEGAAISVTLAQLSVVSVSNADCGLCNGEIILMAGNVSYDWSDGGSGAERDDLCEGFYTVVVTDANGCTNELTLQIQDDCGCIQPLVTEIVVVEANCGASNGEVSLELLGDPTNYFYQWDPNVGMGNSFGNGRFDLPAGIYSITISDNIDPFCFTVIEFAIGATEGPTPVDATVSPSNCDLNNGTVNLSPATYDYIWQFDNTVASSRSDLAAGIYQLIVVDPQSPNCPDYITVVVGEENNLIVQEILSTEPTCGQANGTVFITIVSGGSGSQTYEWSDDPSANAAVRNDLAAGTYEVTVTDLISGCATTVSFTLDDNVAGANVNVAAQFETSCIGSDDGQANYLVSFDPGFVQPATETIVDANGNEFTNDSLPPGQYCVQIEDGNGCLAGSGCFEIIEPTMLEVDVAVLPFTCMEGGSIDVEVSGSAGGYTYNWADLPGLNNPQDRIDLQAGIYNLTISDANGCTAVADNLEVIDDCMPTANCTGPGITSVVKIEPTCGLPNGSATIDVVGDEADFTYTWLPNVSSTFEASGLASGVYSVTITDINDPNCLTVATFSLVASNGPEAEVLSTTPASCLLANGTAVLSPINYLYEWCNGATGFNVGSLPAGICFVTVTDFATGCTNILEVEIGITNILATEVIIDAAPDCGMANGEVTIDVTGGSTSYTYDWSDGGTTANRSDLAAGVYSVTVTDNGVTGCSEVLTFTLIDDLGTDAGATVNLVSDSIYLSCVGANDGFADFIVSFDPNFEGPVTIEILNIDNEPQINGNLSPGLYCIVVTDANSCFAGDTCLEVFSPMSIDLDITLMDQTCDTLGVIELVVTGGTAPYTFDWDDLPGANDPQNRVGLSAGDYSVTVSDVNGCIVITNMLPIVDECSGCPSPDTVEMILPVFTEDSVCFVLESCFDTSIVTTYSLTSGGSTGASLFGIWVVNSEGCLYYLANGTEGVGVDTICMVANNAGLLDTTCVIVTIVPACNGLLAVDSLQLSTFDCEAGGSFCLPLSLIEVLDYEFTDNGLPYSGGFMGCDFDTLQTYLLQPLIDIAPVGPYELNSWTVNGTQFEIDTFFTLQQLVDSMNLWDPAGNWILASSTTIQGGSLSSIYGALDISQIITLANAVLPLSSTEIPGSTQMSVDTGYHELIIVEIATGCSDTIVVGVECNACPDLYSGPTMIESENCSDPVDVCLDISIEDIFDYIITDNGDLYTDGFIGCDFDSLVTYLTVGFNTTGNYTLDSWTINNDTFSNVSFSTLQELADSMNVWDPAANWTINGLLLIGGDYPNVYGNINISENGVPSVMANPNLQLVPNGGAISLMPGDHEVVLFDTMTGCTDTVNIIITCDECEPFYSGPDTLYNFDCPQPSSICLELNLDNLSNYLILDNGIPYTSSTLGCNFDSLTTYLTIGFNTFGGYTVDSLIINGDNNLLGFFTSIDELVTWMNIIDPSGNWQVNGLLLIGGDPSNVYGNMVVSEMGSIVATVEPNLQLIPNGISIELDEGFHEVIVVDSVIGCADTFSVQVACITNFLPDTIYLDIMIGFTDTFCLDTNLFPGTIDTIYNICEDESGTNVFVSVIGSTTCIEYTGITLGQDTACIVICDDLGNCDTTIFIIDVIPPMIDTIMTTVVLGDTDTLCFNVSELAGMDYTVTNYCDDQSGVFVDFEISPDTICIEYTGLELGTDTACIEICDELGACDTTIVIVTTILGFGEPPIAVDDDTTAIKGIGVDIDILNNDTINGELASITIITDPLNGTAFVNPDFSITYIPDVDFCGSIDSFEYVLTTSTGSDTAWVYVDVQCDELIIFSGFSPNEDGVNDHFAILGIENFPNNEVQVFNRWGNRVYLKKGYTNADGWTGTWEGKDLPDGTYFYVIDDGEGQQYSGYLQIQR